MQTIDLVLNLSSGLIGGLVGAAAALITYGHGYLRVESIERRKQKIALLDELMAVRYVLQHGVVLTPEEARDFNRAMARIPHVFAEHEDVIAAYDSLCNGSSDQNLFALLEQITIACGLKKYAVSRSHLVRVLTVQAHRTR